MKKLKLFVLNLLFVSFALNAQNKVEHLEIMGKAYTVTKVFPEEILGEYTYEGNGGDPKVLLNKNGTGYFQPHQVKPVDIIFWIDWCNWKISIHIGNSIPKWGHFQKL